jgi:hypothetical protein
MNKLENVLKAMPCLAGEAVPCCECPYSDREGYGRGNRCKKECAADAVAVLKDLEPLEPYVCEGDVKCGNCCEIVGYVRETDGVVERLAKHCPECGRKVKWEWP